MQGANVLATAKLQEKKKWMDVSVCQGQKKARKFYKIECN